MGGKYNHYSDKHPTYGSPSAHTQGYLWSIIAGKLNAFFDEILH